MRQTFTILVCALLCALACALLFGEPALTAGSGGGDQRQAGNEFVSIDIRLEQPSGKAGGRGRIVIWLKPKKGIHVNATPPLDLRLEKEGVGSLSGKLEYATAKHDTALYLDHWKPVKQSFLISPTLKPGVVALKGTFTFFYCSDAEGWCSRLKQPIDLKLTILP